MHSLVRHGMVFYAIPETKKDFTFYFRSFTIERTAYFPQFSKITVLQLQPEVFVSPEPVLPQCIMGKVAAMLSE